MGIKSFPKVNSKVNPYIKKVSYSYLMYPKYNPEAQDSTVLEQFVQHEIPDMRRLVQLDHAAVIIFNSDFNKWGKIRVFSHN